MVEGTYVHEASHSSMRKSMLEVAYWLNTGTLPIDELHSDSGCSLEEEDQEREVRKEENREDGSLLVPSKINISTDNPQILSPKHHTGFNGRYGCKNHNSMNTSHTSSEDTAAYILANSHITKRKDAMMIVEGSKILDSFNHPTSTTSPYFLENNHETKSHKGNHHITASCENKISQKSSMSHKSPGSTVEHGDQNKTKQAPSDSNNLSPDPENESDESIFKSRFLSESSPLHRNSLELRKKKLFQNTGSPIEFSPASEVDSQAMKIVETSRNFDHPALTSPSFYTKTPFSLRRSSLPRKRKYSLRNTKKLSNLTHRKYSSNLSKIREHQEDDHLMEAPDSNPTLKEQGVGIDENSPPNLEVERTRGPSQSGSNRDRVIVENVKPKSLVVNSSKVLGNGFEKQSSKDAHSIEQNAKCHTINEEELRTVLNDTIAFPNEALFSIEKSKTLTAKRALQELPKVNHTQISDEFDITLDEHLQDQTLNDSQSHIKTRNYSKFILVSSSDESEILRPVKKNNVRKSTLLKKSRRESECVGVNFSNKDLSSSKKYVQSSKLVIASSSDESDPPQASCSQESNFNPVRQNLSRRSTFNNDSKILNHGLFISTKTVRSNHMKNSKFHEKWTNLNKSKNSSNSSSDEEIFTPSFKNTQEKVEHPPKFFENKSKDVVGSSIKLKKELEDVQISPVPAVISHNQEISDEEDIYTPSFRISLDNGG